MSETTKALVAELIRTNGAIPTLNSKTLDVVQALNQVSDDNTTTQTQVTALQEQLSSATAIRQDYCVQVNYDFATQGGAEGQIFSGVLIPADSIITKVYYKILTAPTSADDTGELTLMLDGGSDLTAAIVADGAASGIADGLPDWSAASMEETAIETELVFDISVEDITAGAVVYFVFYNTQA